jgi:hypothetical protein
MEFQDRVDVGTPIRPGLGRLDDQMGLRRLPAGGWAFGPGSPG